MAGPGSQAPKTSTTSRSASANNNTASADYINGHGSLPDAPAPNAAQAPVAPTTKKGKGKKAADANETGKLLAAKINQLEQDAAGEKDQEVEIGGCSSTHASKDNVLASMRKHDLPQDMIAEVAKAFDEGAKVSMVEQGLPSLETMESLLANFSSLTSPSLDIPRIYESLFNRPLPKTAMDQHKLTELPPGLFADIEREVKKATRDLSNLLTGLETPLSKLEAVQKKYTDLVAEMNKVMRDNTKNKKRSDALQKEKDASRSELTKTNAMRDKLEKLCRELSKENKSLKAEQKTIEDSERRSREEFSERADALFRDLESQIDSAENPERGKLDIELDELFRQKFKSFIEQYEGREAHYLALSRSKESEVQLTQARADESRKRAEMETARARTLSAQVSTFSQTETELRNQLNIYVEKFKQVEDTLNNSNDLFLTFRKEMEEMSKKTKRLEKENLNLSRKHDLTNRNILEMAEERTKLNKEMETLRKKNNTLESVIRQMQEQGRAPAAGGALEGDEEGTESDYEDDEDDYDDGSEEAEYDDDTEEEALHAPPGALPTYGPAPPPPPNSQQAQINGKVNGDVHGVKSIAV
ncbi:hypothetical protein ACLMJK_006072 [Lecanora helva]